MDVLFRRGSDGYAIVDGELVLTVTLFVKNKEFTRQVKIPVADETIGITELLSKPADGEAVYVLEGVVAAVASTETRVEYLLIEPSTGSFIGVQGITSSGTVTAGTYLPVFSAGDRVRIPVSLAKSATAAGNSDSDKIYAKYAGGSLYETAILEKGVAVVPDKQNALQISCQDDLRNMLCAENRSNNHYTYVKLNGPINCIRYGTSTVHYRFFFDGVTSYAQQNID